MIEGIEGVDEDRLLVRFAQWLRDLRAETDRVEENGQPAAEAPVAVAEIGLYRLVEEFTALRQEIKLQTRGSRVLEERAETLVDALGQAIDALRSIEPREEQAAWSAGKSFATTLAELDDALERGRQQTEKAVCALENGPSVTIRQLVSEFHQAQSGLARRLHEDYQRRLCDWLERHDEQEPRRKEFADALIDGYRLIQKRLSQAMASEGIARMTTVGQPVDPEQMVVVEAVVADDFPDGVVFDELRPGYTWHGSVLRYAEVRATRRGL